MADAYKGLTIKFRADTTALSKALSTLRAEAKSAQTSLSSVEKALKLDPSNVELLAQKEQYASQKAAALREKLDLVSRALSDGGAEKGSEAYNRLQRELVTTNDALGKAEAAASEARDALAGEAEAAERGADANRSFGSSADDASKKALAITVAADKAGQALSNTLTPAAKQFASSSVQVAGNFESAMSQVSAALGDAGADTEALSSLAKQMGATTVFSANQAAGAMVELAKGGLTEAQIQSGALASAMDLAAAGGLGLSDAASTIVQAMGAFGLLAGETSRAANALAGSANASSADVGDLTQALSQCLAGASNAGWSIEETAAVLGKFTDAGINGSDAGTSLKTMLQRLSAPTDEAATAMDDLGISVRDSDGEMLGATDVAQVLRDRLASLDSASRDAALSTIFGSDAMRAATVLMKSGADGLSSYVAATNDAGAASTMASAQLGGMQRAMAEMDAAVESAKIAWRHCTLAS